MDASGDERPARTVFAGTDLVGADFRDVDLTDARITGVIRGLTVNDVEIEPLINAELDRRFPERVPLRSEDPAVLGPAWAGLVENWDATIDRAARLPRDLQLQRVRGEWSVCETMRHLVFVIDDWFRATIMALPRPYWPAGLPPTFVSAGERLGIDAAAAPGFEDVRAVLHDRMRQVSVYMGSVTGPDLRRRCPPGLSAGPGMPVTVIECLHNVLDEVWAHHRFAERDLRAIASHEPTPG